ncbi:unnamed protein product [Closterium sp. Yama58-4]|nr:unnamed protein product [Closterium sp. Yama58-4]
MSRPTLIRAHRCILAAWSPVFSRMFETGFQEEKSKFVKIEDMDNRTLDLLLTFMYTGVVDLPVEISKGLLLLAAADKYGVQELKQRLDKGLCESINDDNAFECFKFSDMHSAALLREASSKHILECMDVEESLIPLKCMLLGDNNVDRKLAVELVEILWLK